MKSIHFHERFLLLLETGIADKNVKIISMEMKLSLPRKIAKTATRPIHSTSEPETDWPGTDQPATLRHVETGGARPSTRPSVAAPAGDA
jgi:hypothetical protein